LQPEDRSDELTLAGCPRKVELDIGDPAVVPAVTGIDASPPTVVHARLGRGCVGIAGISNEHVAHEDRPLLTRLEGQGVHRLRARVTSGIHPADRGIGDAGD